MTVVRKSVVPRPDKGAACLPDANRIEMKSARNEGMNKRGWVGDV